MALGAISDTGEVYLNPQVKEAAPDWLDEWLDEECAHQRSEITRRRKLFRTVRPVASIAGRSVIVTDDGIATGSTMIAALKVVRTQKPHELIVAVPVASPTRLEEVRHWCDETVCLLTTEDFWAVGQFYENFEQVEDDQVVAILRTFAPALDGTGV